MDRNLRKSLPGSKNNNNNNNSNISTSSNRHRRRQSLNGGLLFPKDSDDNLDLFSKNRSSLSFADSDESSDVNLRRLSLGSAKVKGELDDLLSSTDGGKHDYDWLMTPPTTPFSPSSKGSESKSATVSLASRRNTKVRPISTPSFASRLLLSPSESNHSTRPTRSNSVTRSYGSSYSNCSSNKSTSSSINRSPPSTARATTPSACSTKSRPSTLSKVCSSPNGSYMDKSRPSQSSSPSTPTSRLQIHANLNSSAIGSNPRPSTPTSRNPMLSPSSEIGASPSSGHIVSNGHSVDSASRRRSSCLRVRPSQQPIVPPDFHIDAPANRRTTLPDRRAVSVVRSSRPSGSITMKAKQDTTSFVNMAKRDLSPIVIRGRLTESNGKTRLRSNGHAYNICESGKKSPVSDLAMRKLLKSPTTTANSSGFGRTISKNSSHMAIRHKDMGNGAGSIRSLSSTTMFPHSIQSANAKTQSLCSISASDSENNNGSPSRLENGDLSENGSSISRHVENGSSYDDGMYFAILSEVDIYESSGYDIMLLKEDLKNTNWLHGIGDKSDQVSIFDNVFEPLPEPFGLL